MRTSFPVAATALFVLVALSGCAGKDKTEGGTDVDPADYSDSDKFDDALGNQGFQVSGGLTGAGTAIDATSAAQVRIVDLVPSDAAGAGDRATLVVDAKTQGLQAQASMRSMVTGQEAGFPIDFQGGAAQNIRLAEATGGILGGLPDVRCFILTFGLARVILNGALQSNPVPVIAAVTLGMRDASGALLSAEDTHDLELHVVFLSQAFPGGSLYFYFEQVNLGRLSEEDKAKVGQGLVPFEKPNVAPTISARILVGGQQASSATKEGSANVTATFDASASTDPDGRIDAYSWQVFALNANGTYDPEPGGRVSGPEATYEFKEAGVKLVTLRLIDDDGAIATTDLTFFVDSRRMVKFEKSPLQQGAVFVQCYEAYNCASHEVLILKAATQATFKYTYTGTAPAAAPQRVHLDLIMPSQGPCQAPPPGQNPTPVASQTNAESGTPLVVPGSKLTEVGKWKLCAWFEAGIDPNWEIDVGVQYSPVTS